MNLLGTHALLTLQTELVNKLIAIDDFIEFVDNLLIKYKLESVGVVKHQFENESFTAAFCLKESHICIHTWPELKMLTADVYLCNYSAYNNEKVKNIADEIIVYFKAVVVKHLHIER